MSAPKKQIPIKKIALNVWTLRAETEAVVKLLLEDNRELVLDRSKLIKLVEDYTNPPPVESDGDETRKVVISQKKPAIPKDMISYGKTILYEISMDDILFFCERGFMEGQAIIIEFKVPKHFFINAEVVHCRPINQKTSRLISEKKLTHRIKAKFTFIVTGERTLLRQFVKSIGPETGPEPEEKKGSEDDADLEEIDETDEVMKDVLADLA